MREVQPWWLATLARSLSTTNGNAVTYVRVEERAHLRATTILCLEKYEGGAPAPAEGGLDGAIAARRYCKDVWSVIMSFI